MRGRNLVRGSKPVRVLAAGTGRRGRRARRPVVRPKFGCLCALGCLPAPGCAGLLLLGLGRVTGCAFGRADVDGGLLICGVCESGCLPAASHKSCGGRKIR